MAEHRLHRFEHASPIGRWSVTVCTPDPRLADVVATMWYGEGHVAYQRDRILPSGQSQLLINLGPPQYRIEPGPPERRVPFVDVWYSGLHQGPIDTEAPHGNALLGVAFSARGTYPWLGPQLEGLADRIIALADALGDGVLALRERLLNTPATIDRFTIVEHWLIARLSPRQAVHPAVRWAVDRIAATGGMVPVARPRDADRLHAQAPARPFHAPGRHDTQGALPHPPVPRRAGDARRRDAGAVGGARGPVRVLRPVAPHQRVPVVQRAVAGRARARRPAPIRRASSSASGSDRVTFFQDPRTAARACWRHTNHHQGRSTCLK